MRNSKAKKIRKSIYGDYSPKERVFITEGGVIRNHPDSRRAKYQMAKRESRSRL